VQVVPAVHFGSHDRAIARRLERRGVSVYIQPLPRDEKIPVRDLDPSGERKPSGLFNSQTADMPIPHLHPERRPSTAGAAVPQRMAAKLRVINERGLHLRAAHALAHLAASLPENVQVSNGPDSVNAKSLLGLTTLGATCGTVLEVVVTGPNPAAAMDKIRALFAGGFDEGAKPGLRVEGDG
jgi:phosphocarrier protein HPr